MSDNKQLRIHVTTSWRHKHLADLVISGLRERGYDVPSFLGRPDLEAFDKADDAGKEAWYASTRGILTYKDERQRILSSDLVVYLGPSGVDAWFEVGVASGLGKYVLGLTSKGEQAGLSRHGVNAFADTVNDLYALIATYKQPGEGR